MPAITRGFAQAPPAVPEGRRKLRVYDDRLSGFIMEIWTTGTICFYVRYRDARSRQREIRLGRLGDVTVDQARKRAQEIRAQASLGVADPAAERDRLRAVLTVTAFMEGRYLPFVEERLKSARDHQSFWRLRVKALWGARRLDEVRPADVVDLQDRLRREGLSNATVNRYTAFVRRVFSLAIRWEALDGRNPAAHAEMRREQHRERYLGEAELPAKAGAPAGGAAHPAPGLRHRQRGGSDGERPPLAQAEGCGGAAGRDGSNPGALAGIGRRTGVPEPDPRHGALHL